MERKNEKISGRRQNTKSPDLTTVLIIVTCCYFEPHCLQPEVWVKNNDYSVLINLHRVP